MMARKSKQTKVPAMKAGQKGIPQQLIASSQSSDLVDESARKGNTPLFISPPWHNRDITAWQMTNGSSDI